MYPVNKNNNMKTEIPKTFFDLEVERDNKNRITDNFLKKVIAKIGSVSALINIESKRGPAQKVTFVGRMSSHILKEIENNVSLYASLKRQFVIESKPSVEDDYIELFREGDNLYLEAVKDNMGIEVQELRYSKEKQPDVKYIVKIIENKKE